jgi:biopolymer transport protein ExbD
MRIESPGRQRSLISLTPLIDVVFILLLFFMLTSNFTQLRAIGITIPAEAGAPAGGEQTVLVRVHADERLELDGQPVQLSELAERIRQVANGRPVLVQPVGDARLQTLVTVLDQLAGVPGVSLARP